MNQIVLNEKEAEMVKVGFLQLENILATIYMYLPENAAARENLLVVNGLLARIDKVYGGTNEQT